MNRYIKSLGALALGTYITLSLMGCNGVARYQNYHLDNDLTGTKISSKEDSIVNENNYFVYDKKSGNICYIQDGLVMIYESKILGEPIILGKIDPNKFNKDDGIEGLVKAMEEFRCDDSSLEKNL
jgi:hypothetical protein